MRELREAFTREAGPKAERAVRDSEARFRAIFEQAAVGIVEASFDGTLVRVNRRFCAILGYTGDELIGRTFQTLTHPDDRERSVSHAERVMTGQTHPASIEKRYLRRDGTATWVSVSPALVSDVHGRPLSFIAAVEDISERKAATHALRESEQRYRRLIETSPDVIWSVDREERISFVSEACRQVLGYAPEEMIGHPVARFCREQDQSAVREVIGRALGGETVTAFETSRRRKDGTEILVSYSAAPLRGEDGAICGATGRTSDITGLRQAEIAARDNAEKLKLALRAIDMAVFTQDRELRYTWMYQAQQGYRDEDVLGRTDAELLPPDAARTVTALKQRVLASGRADRCEVRLTRPEGRFNDYALVVEPLRSGAGEIAGVRGVSLDITARTMAEEELRKSADRLRRSEERFRSLIENAVDLILGVDPSGAMQFVSPSVFRLLGYDAAALLGLSALEFIHPDDAGTALEALRRALEGVEQPKAVTLRIRHADGSWHSMEAVGNRVGEIGQLVINARDITDRVRLEGQLHQAQKMEAIGQLTGGIAHDFNNLLSVIIANAEALIEQTPEGDLRRADAAEVMKAGERAAVLTRQLLAFSRKQVLDPRVVSVNAIVGGTEKLLRGVIGEHIHFSAALTPDAGQVFADPGQLEQVLINLAVNAREAMPRGGNLLVEVRNVELDGEYVQGHPPAKAGRYVMISVSDSGCGMDAETRRRAFEPFFTTKEKGHGTGLGLSTCYGIVKQSEGYIWLYSEPGCGTTLKIYLPRVDRQADAASVPDAAPTRGGGETVLVVEDEESLRRVVQRTLSARGYSVRLACDAAEGLAICSGPTGASIDLILSDVITPLLSGPEMGQRLRAAGNRTPILFMSGYVDGMLPAGGVLQPGVNFLQKPFTAGELARKVREVLDAPTIPEGT